MNDSRLLGGILLVAGTAIGAGMLALPISTGLAGFYPSLFLFFLSWGFMTFTAFLLLEVNLWMEDEADLISMAQSTLGSFGKYVSGISYLLLLYALTAAYIGGSAHIVGEAVENLAGISLPEWFEPVPVLVFFSSVVYLGTQSVDYLNRLLMVGLIASYSLLVFFAPGHVRVENFEHTDWSYLTIAVSVVVTSFGFHVVIPFLATYLDRELRKLKIALFVGCLIPLCVYAVWEFLVLGVVPLHGANSILEAWAGDMPATDPLKASLQNPWLSVGAQFFAFFSISTSFLGVSLSLFHFIADALGLQKGSSGKLVVCMLTFLPPLAFVLTGSRGFYLALEYAGVFVAILLGILPALMAWSVRKQTARPATYTVMGGKLSLVMAICFFSGVVVLEVANKMGLLQCVVSEYIK